MSALFRIRSWINAQKKEAIVIAYGAAVLAPVIGFFVVVDYFRSAPLREEQRIWGPLISQSEKLAGNAQKLDAPLEPGKTMIVYRDEDSIPYRLHTAHFCLRGMFAAYSPQDVKTVILLDLRRREIPHYYSGDYSAWQKYYDTTVVYLDQHACFHADSSLAEGGAVPNHIRVGPKVSSLNHDPDLYECPSAKAVIKSLRNQGVLPEETPRDR